MAISSPSPIPKLSTLVISALKLMVAVCGVQLSSNIEAAAKQVGEQAPEQSKKLRAAAEEQAQNVADQAKPTAENVSKTLEDTARDVAKGEIYLYYIYLLVGIVLLHTGSSRMPNFTLYKGSFRSNPQGKASLYGC